MIIKYINSNNKSIEFIAKNMLPTAGYFHERKWNTSKENDVTNIDLSDCTYNITLTLRGTLTERKTQLDLLCDAFEYDCANNIPGTLFFGDYYIKCYVITSNVSVANIQTRTNVELGIYCPRQQWIKETKYALNMYSEEKTENEIKQYTYSYPFVYSNLRGNIQIINNAVSDSDFIIRMYGACSNPYVKIGDILYQVNTTLGNNEYLEINSQENTIYGYSNYGEKRNLFNYRDKSRSDFFEKIPTGSAIATWDGSFKAEIIVFDVRNEPRWVQ